MLPHNGTFDGRRFPVEKLPLRRTMTEEDGEKKERKKKGAGAIIRDVIERDRFVRASPSLFARLVLCDV